MKRTARSFDRLHRAPDQADLALVLIDVVNDLEFDAGVRIFPSSCNAVCIPACANDPSSPVLKANISSSLDLELVKIASQLAGSER